MSKRWIPVSAPMLVGNEKAYVMDCMESGWISSMGKYVEKFEAAFAEFCGTKHAISCCNGTAALHLSLLALGVGAGDEVIVPTLTFVATANAVTYCGALPIFVDSEAEAWTLDSGLIEAKITPRTRVIIAVHLYGYPAHMSALKAIARRYNLFIIEDAAEAHGATYKGRRVGSLGDIAAFSFYGNKIIATGEGGMVVTDDDALATRAAQFRGQGQDFERRYWFPVIGYNYRMMNLPAAIGLAQLECFNWHIQRRSEIAVWYQEGLRDVAGVTWQVEREGDEPAHWLFSIILNEDIHADRDAVMSYLEKQGIETRPVFYPMHVLPPYLELAQNRAYPVAERIAQRGLSLPTWAGVTREDVRFICDVLRECLQETRRLSRFHSQQKP